MGVMVYNDTDNYDDDDGDDDNNIDNINSNKKITTIIIIIIGSSISNNNSWILTIDFWKKIYDKSKSNFKMTTIPNVFYIFITDMIAITLIMKTKNMKYSKNQCKW